MATQLRAGVLVSHGPHDPPGRPFSLRIALAVGCFAIVALFSGPIAAGQKENVEAAREHSNTATAAYNLGQYLEASREFEAAYKLVQDPAFLFNLGQAYRLGGDPEKALTAYRSYLRNAAPAARDREQAQKWKADMEAAARLAKIGAVNATAASGKGGPALPTTPAAEGGPATVTPGVEGTAPMAHES